MSAPDFKMIGDALKILGDQISKFSELPALTNSQRDEPMQDDRAGDGIGIMTRGPGADSDERNMAMELEGLRARSNALTLANNNNHAARQLNADRVSLRDDAFLSMLMRDTSTQLTAPRNSANEMIRDFPKTTHDLKHIRCDDLTEILQGLGLSTQGGYLSRLYRLADFVGVAEHLFEVKRK